MFWTGYRNSASGNSGKWLPHLSLAAVFASRPAAPQFFLLCLLLSSSAIADNHPAVCRVEFAGWGGSGTLICVDEGKAVVLTAWHVLESGARRGRKDPTCIFRTGQQEYRIRANSIRKGPADSAAIVFDAWKVQSIQPMRLWPKAVYRRMPVWAEGYGGNRFGRRRGYVVNTYGNSVTTNLPSIPGDSGGVVLTSDTNNVPYLVGIVSESDFQTMTVGPRCTPIRTWLAALGVGITDLGRAVCMPRRTLQGRGWAAPYSVPRGST